MGSTTLFSAVFISPEQVVSFLLCKDLSFSVSFSTHLKMVFAVFRTLNLNHTGIPGKL